MHAWGLLALIVAATACGSDRDPGPPRPKSGFEPLWAVAWEEASDSQREAMADGEVTFAEYEAAALRAVQCIDEIDGVVRGEARYSEHTRTYELGARYSLPPGERITIDNMNESPYRERGEKTDACYREHWNGINNAWAAQNQPSEQELFAARQALAACLREAGIDVPDPASQEDFAGLERTESYFPCVERIEEEFGIPGFGG
jgi:hypothetical protein